MTGRYKKLKQYLAYFLFNRTCPNPTTEVAEVGLRLALAFMKILAWSLNILGGILLLLQNVSMVNRKLVLLFKNSSSDFFAGPLANIAIHESPAFALQH
ncbi:MAG: hypothetical protein HYR70_05655 [Chloroflexi bacterium]|nr:hypothetical protein [Chloroflexota bacterium]MBI3338720.1 hypothetical protein [Chloroflexota bacterium]